MIYYHYAELVHRQAEKYGSRTALKYRDNATGKWLKISWKEFSEKVMLTAIALAVRGSVRFVRNGFEYGDVYGRIQFVPAAMSVIGWQGRIGSARKHKELYE